MTRGVVRAGLGDKTMAVVTKKSNKGKTKHKKGGKNKDYASKGVRHDPYHVKIGKGEEVKKSFRPGERIKSKPGAKPPSWIDAGEPTSSGTVNYRANLPGGERLGVGMLAMLYGVAGGTVEGFTRFASGSGLDVHSYIPIRWVTAGRNYAAEKKIDAKCGEPVDVAKKSRLFIQTLARKWG